MEAEHWATIGFTFIPPSKVGIIISILQMRKGSSRKAKQFAKGHTVSQWWGQNSNPAQPCL